MSKADKNQPTEPSAGCDRASTRVLDYVHPKDRDHHDWKKHPAVRELVKKARYMLIADSSSVQLSVTHNNAVTHLQAALEPFKEDTDETKD